MTRRLGTDREDPQCGACAGRPVQEPGGQMVCPAGSGRGRARDGNTPRRGQEQCGLALRPTGDGGHAGRLAVASAVGAGYRLLAGAWRLSLSRSYTGYHRAWLPAGKPGPAGGALMSGAMAGRNTPAGGGPVGMALRARSCGRQAAGRVTASRGPGYGCRNHRRPGSFAGTRRWPRSCTPHGAPDPSLQGSALAPHHGVRVRGQDWGAP